MRLLLVAVMIDALKWIESPLRHLRRTTMRLLLRHSDLLVSLQFKHHKLKKEKHNEHTKTNRRMGTI